VNDMDSLITQLIEEKFAGYDLSHDVKEQLKRDLADRVEDCINACILRHIPDNRMADFERLLDMPGDNSPAIQAYLVRG
jgi:hypothetical protein